VGVGRPVDIHRGVHRLGRTSGSPVADERHVVPKLHSNAPGSLQERVGQETNQDDPLLTVALELMVRSVFGKPLEAQCSVATISPGCAWKSSWKVPPQVSLAKTCRSAASSW